MYKNFVRHQGHLRGKTNMVYFNHKFWNHWKPSPVNFYFYFCFNSWLKIFTQRDDIFLEWTHFDSAFTSIFVE